MALTLDSDTTSPVQIAFGARSAAPPVPIRVISGNNSVRIDTGRAVFEVVAGGSFPLSSVSAGGGKPIDESQSGYRVDVDGRLLAAEVAGVRVVDDGPLRAEVEVRGVLRGPGASELQVSARLEMFAGSATVRAHITLRNPRAAAHPGGQWVLGDAGSCYLKSASWNLSLAGGSRSVRCAAEPGTSFEAFPTPFELHQESSGGSAWNGPIHRDRHGRVPLRFPGYRLRAAGVERTGLRASPVLVAECGTGAVAVAVPKFWENFPQALSVDAGVIVIGLFPSQAPDLHELQGGEQKTHSVVIAFDGDDSSGDKPLAWVHDPLLLYPSPEWCAETAAVPFLQPASQDPSAEYLRLVESALDPADGFAAKRERADEYGWRNFGDLPGDHESAYLDAGQMYVSHYNNQYDALACFAIHFLRTGDPRWHALMCDLAAHVRDIDIYHTTRDKAAYNGGLFWHTDHYVDAGTSTHRTYPAGSHGGGPSGEHNYNLGLMLHYFLTGDPASSEAAIGLGQWVLDMDDGRQTVFRWLSRGATGLASASGSSSYHGPGRGGANSVMACLVARRLSGDERFERKIEELLRRCIHPADDLVAMRLDDVERRWFYTMFLQALGAYVWDKRERGELDDRFEYGRASLLHYARWIAEHESPYLDRPERLEFPNETWVAQDLRKADALLWAAFFTAQDDERRRFTTRASEFFSYAVSTLTQMPGHVYTRPTVVALANGWRYRGDGHADVQPPSAPRSASTGWSGPAVFVPQKARASNRARWLVYVALAAAGAAAVSLVL